MTAARRVSRVCSGRRPAQTASWIVAWMRGFAAVRAPKCAESRDVSRSFVPHPGLACTECRLRHTVWEEALERPLPNLVEDFSSPFLMQDRVAVHSQDVVDAADSQTFPWESKFCLRVLAQLNAFVHCSNDIRLGQELKRHLGHVLHVTKFPLVSEHSLVTV